METQKIILQLERLLPSVAKLILLILAISTAALLVWPVLLLAPNVLSSQTAEKLFGALLILFTLLFSVWLWHLPKLELFHGKPRVDTVADIWRELPEHPELPSLMLADAAQHYDSWHGEDLWRYTRDQLAPDPHPIARIHHAAALFSLGLDEAARDVLDKAAQPERILPIAIAQVDLLELQGSLIPAANSLQSICRALILPLDVDRLLTARELELRVRAGQLDIARSGITKLLDSIRDRSRRTLLHELFAEIPLTCDCPDFVPDALEHIERALVIDPSNPKFKRTKGALLYEALQRDQAEKWLRSSLAETFEPEDRAVCHFYLALIERKRGHLLESKRLAGKIPTSPIPHWLLPRWKYLVP